MTENQNAMKMFFIIAPCLYLVNISVAALFVRKYDDIIYKKNLYFWIAHLIFSLSQAIVMENQISHEVAIFIWAFFALMQFLFQSIVITDIFNINVKIRCDIMLFTVAAILSCILLKSGIQINISVFPVVFFTAWPIIKHFKLFKNFNQNNFTKNGFLVCSAIMSLHVLDYSYAFDKPEYIFPGYLFALILTTGTSAFSFAVLVERALVHIEMKDILHNTARLSALGGMAGEIAHEINNPFNCYSFK